MSSSSATTPTDELRSGTKPITSATTPYKIVCDPGWQALHDDNLGDTADPRREDRPAVEPSVFPNLERWNVTRKPVLTPDPEKHAERNRIRAEWMALFSSPVFDDDDDGQTRTYPSNSLVDGMDSAREDLLLAGQRDTGWMVAYAGGLFAEDIRAVFVLLDSLPPVDFDELRATIGEVHDCRGREQLNAMIRLGRCLTLSPDDWERYQKSRL